MDLHERDIDELMAIMELEVRRTASRAPLHERDELTQRLRLRIWSAIERYDPGRGVPMRAWLRSHLAWEAKRTNSDMATGEHEQLTEQLQLTAPDRNPLEQMLIGEQLRHAVRLLHRLSDTDRELIVRSVDGTPQPWTTLGLTHDAYQARRRRLTQRLRDLRAAA